MTYVGVACVQLYPLLWPPKQMRLLDKHCVDVLHHAGCTELSCMGMSTKNILAGCQLAGPGHSSQLTTEGQSRVCSLGCWLFCMVSGPDVAVGAHCGNLPRQHHLSNGHRRQGNHQAWTLKRAESQRLAKSTLAFSSSELARKCCCGMRFVIYR